VNEDRKTPKRLQEGGDGRYALPFGLRRHLLGPQKLEVLEKLWDMCVGTTRSGHSRMSLPAFTNFFSTLGGIPEGHCSRYFSAFAHLAPTITNGDVRLEFWQFVCGVYAMLPSTSDRDSYWGDLRIRYIFRLYDKWGSGALNMDDFRLMLHHILIAEDKPADMASVEQAVKANKGSFGAPAPALYLEAFAQAIKTGRFRGTFLFRFPKQAPILALLEAQDPLSVLPKVMARAQKQRATSLFKKKQEQKNK